MASVWQEHGKSMASVWHDKAIENLIYLHDTHIDILTDKLPEPRVRRVSVPMLAYEDEVDDALIPTDDIQLCGGHGNEEHPYRWFST